MVTRTEWAKCIPMQVLCGYARGGFGSHISFLGCRTGESRGDFIEKQRMCDKLLVLLI